MQAASASIDHHEYAYLGELREAFSKATTNISNLFTTDATGLWDAYLSAFPADERQHFNCHACRRFIETYGALVVIAEDGRTSSPLWDALPSDALYLEPFKAMAQIVRRARVTGVFMSKEKVWGIPRNFDGKHDRHWEHLAVTPPKALVYSGSVLTPYQAAAEKAEDFRTVSRALAEFALPSLEQVLVLLKSDTMYRSEKVLGQAQWLHDRQAERQANKAFKDNLLWRSVAAAPAGFCHPRSSMIGTLLEDIASGMDFSQVSSRFAAKMHPLQYQRPQAAPAAGAIAAAEKLVEQMGLAPSLRRRFATLDDVQAIWKPSASVDAPKVGGVFGHLKARDQADIKALELPAVTMTWDKFLRTVLPEAQEIEYMFPHGAANISTLVTAADPDAPPLLQWDREEPRNPVSSYVWHGGSTASQYGLSPGFIRVSAVTYRPSMWNERVAHLPHMPEGVLFLLDGAKESRNAGLAIFPENVRGDLHGVRAVIEAHSRSGEIEGKDKASASGVLLDKGGTWNALFRVKTKTGLAQYKIDRWD